MMFVIPVFTSVLILGLLDLAMDFKTCQKASWTSALNKWSKIFPSLQTATENCKLLHQWA